MSHTTKLSLEASYVNKLITNWELFEITPKNRILVYKPGNRCNCQLED